MRPDSVGDNAQWLRRVPVRVYCEPDLAYWQQHYCASLQAEDLNAYSANAFRRACNAKATRTPTILPPPARDFRASTACPMR